MKTLLLALAGGVVSFLAFPPFGPGWLIVAGLAFFLWSLRTATTRRQGFWVGFAYGLVFFGGFMWWLSQLELIALILIPVQALFPAVFGWWLAGHREKPSPTWLLLAVGGWALMEVIRYHFPVGGLEWGAAGYALSDNLYTRLPAAAVGTSGLTVIVVMIAGLIAIALTRDWDRRLAWGVPVVALALVGTVPSIVHRVDAVVQRVAIVQGSTPCPFEQCPPNERLRTYEQHLALTETIDAGSVDLVVWPEGSTGSTNADPVNNPEIGEAIGAQARRIGAPMLVGGDRTVDDTHWVNANVYFDADGVIVGEYRKQHPVPFGEYIPWRPVFEWIPALDRVPRDMIPGDGPVVFDGGLGSVISFEGGFSRYAFETRRAGADVIVVNTNNASYGLTPASDIWMGMTRMRAAELGVPIIHSAVTGKSTVMDYQGSFETTTGLGTQEIYEGTYGPTTATLYSFTGNLVMYGAALLGFLAWHRARALVGSGAMQSHSSSMESNSQHQIEED
jgi:apolipoprotein N-acyltransferase